MRILGMPTLHVGRRLTRRLDVLLDVGGVAWGDTLHLDLRAALRWRVGRAWDVGLGYRLLLSDLATADLSSSLASDEAFVEIGRRF